MLLLELHKHLREELRKDLHKHHRMAILQMDIFGELHEWQFLQFVLLRISGGEHYDVLIWHLYQLRFPHKKENEKRAYNDYFIYIYIYIYKS